MAFNYSHFAFCCRTFYGFSSGES